MTRLPKIYTQNVAGNLHGAARYVNRPGMGQYLLQMTPTSW